MAKRDWDRAKRRERVASRGAERSEYTDIVEEIAKAKGYAKVHGTNLVKCANPECDGYYEIGHEDEHRHYKCPKRPRKRRFGSQFKKGISKPTKNVPQGLSIVIRDDAGEIVKRVRL